VDDESVQKCIAAFEEHGTDLPIDYEHQTLGGSFASPSGQAPAAGWIKRIFGEPGQGLMAEIEWTDQGRAMVASKQYRYLSPVAVIRKADRKLVGIHSAALTNKPAIAGMEPLVNQVQAAGSDETPLVALRQELGLPGEAEVEEILAAAGRRIRELTEAARRRHVEERVAEAFRAGKLAEAQRAWAEELIAREEALFDEWFRTAPVVVVPGRTAGPREGHMMSSFGPSLRNTQAVTARARAEFRSSPLLARLTTEDAYVAEALRESQASVN
jgi:phage I-like protein